MERNGREQVSRSYRRAIGAAGALAIAAIPLSASGPAAAKHQSTVQHVLLLSIDGMHQSDLDFYVNANPSSTLAKLVHKGAEFTNAQTPVPSDSFPGMVAQVTGGNPSSTGVYYDDTWNNALLPTDTTLTQCLNHTAKPGVEVTYFEQLDRNPLALDAGQGLPGLPGSILQMTGAPSPSLIDATQLPIDPNTCARVYPHNYLRVNTVFGVLHSAGKYTAWSDKHVAYEILNGPGDATNINDLFAPEINSNAPTITSSIDWTKDNLLTQQYDNYKVEAVLNEINGHDHSGTHTAPVPALFGMNFQTVSTAEKLPMSQGQPGGYLADGVTPGPVLMRALDFINTEVGRMVDTLKQNKLDKTTTIILSAKHGQSPMEPSALTRIPDGPIMSALNAAWAATPGHAGTTLVNFSVNDDAMLIWLSDHSPAATAFAKDFLLHHGGIGNDINGNPKAYTASGLATVFAGAEAASYFGVSAGNPLDPASGASRVPDIFGIVQHGVVYTGGHGKIAEHGGADPQDRHVPLVVSGAGIDRNGSVNSTVVETTEIAPTILELLGFQPDNLQSVQIEHTPVLPIGS
jgi:hypothetical protein